MRTCILFLFLLLLAGPAAASDGDAAAARRWIAGHALPLAGTDPEDQGRDLAALDAVVGGARIAGFGEATHGGREFFQFKHRAFRHLVEHDGFTAFALEANFAEAAAIDAWVKGGPGEPEALLAGLGFWTWETEEVAALLRWIRAYNAAHARQVSVYGIDIQYAPANLRLALAYLQRAGAADAPSPQAFEAYMAAAPTISAGYRVMNGYAPQQSRSLRDAAVRLLDHLDANRAALSARTGAAEFQRARAAALAAAWYFVMEGPRKDLRFTALRQDYDVRDRAMADLAIAALEMEGERGRLFVWAHNAHVGLGRHVDERLTMGQFLRQDLGRDYVSIGFAFDRGAFQAMPPADPSQPERKRNLSEMRVGPAPDDHSEAVLRAGPRPAYMLDLRRLDPGASAYGWFARPRPLRWTGALFSPELMAKHPPLRLVEHYDALLFVHETTRARPTAAARRRLDRKD